MSQKAHYRFLMRHLVVIGRHRLIYHTWKSFVWVNFCGLIPVAQEFS